jgi:hypothetical protein
VDDAKGGKTGKCPKCQSQFVIPAAEGLSPATDPSAPIEIAPCPGCAARLSVAASDLGVDVECPYCRTVYTAKKAGAEVAPRSRPRRLEEDDRPSRRDDDEGDRPRRRRRDEDDED